MSDFVIEPISSQLQQSLLQGTDRLQSNPVETVVANASPGYPCRISLQEAQVGEELYLFSHTPFTIASAYRETGPVFVRKNAVAARLNVNELPDIALARSIVVRAYDGAGTMIAASAAESGEIANMIQDFFRDEAVEFVHLRAAVSGCFLCEARRA